MYTVVLTYCLAAHCAVFLCCIVIVCLTIVWWTKASALSQLNCTWANGCKHHTFLSYYSVDWSGVFWAHFSTFQYSIKAGQKDPQSSNTLHQQCSIVYILCCTNNELKIGLTWADLMQSQKTPWIKIEIFLSLTIRKLPRDGPRQEWVLWGWSHREKMTPKISLTRLLLGNLHCEHVFALLALIFIKTPREV